jgi:hypothetical protein
MVMNSSLRAGVLAAVATAGMVAGALLESGLPPPPSQVLFIVLTLILPGLGLLLVRRRPDIRYGWLLLVTGVCLGLGGLGVGLSIRVEDVRGPAAVLTAFLAVFYGLSWVFVPLLFPEGRLPSPRSPGWRVS